MPSKLTLFKKYALIFLSLTGVTDRNSQSVESIAAAGDLTNAGDLLPELELTFAQAVEALPELLITQRGKINQ